MHTATFTTKADATREEQAAIATDKQTALNTALLAAFNADNDGKSKQAALGAAIVARLGYTPNYAAYATARDAALDAVSPTPKNGGDKTKRATATTLWNRAVKILEADEKTPFFTPESDDPDAIKARQKRAAKAATKGAEEAANKQREVEVMQFALSPDCTSMLFDRVAEVVRDGWTDALREDVNLLTAACRKRLELKAAAMSLDQLLVTLEFIDGDGIKDAVARKERELSARAGKHQEPKDVTPEVEVELLPAPPKVKRAKKAA